jgi:GDP-4-dehydro-6-deoxy-D-mannose reductase
VGRSGEAYNAGSGRVHQIRDVLNRMIRLSRVPMTVDEQGDPARAGDTAVAAADTRKIRAETGWEPTIPLDQTLADILDHWRHLAE